MQVIFVNADIYAANPDRFDMTYDYIYEIDGDDDRVYSYQHVNVSIDVEDSFERDNYFDIYGGQKEVIRVQYASEAPNNFWPAALTEIRNVYEDRWDIQITEVKKGEEPAIEGFDFYIFEHTMPEQMPKDGVLFLVNPDKVPSNLGIRIGNTFQANSSLPLEGGDPHDVLHHITPDKITVTRFNQVVLDGSYTTILGYGNYPMLGVRNEEDSKVVVMPFSLHYSNFAILLDFPLMLYNTFEYFFPATVESNSFEVNETVFLNARGSELTVEGNGGYEQVFDSFPASFTVSEPGTYTLYQTTFTGKDVTEKIYVRVPAEECNIWQTAEAVAEPYKVTDESDLFRDLLLFIAAALVALVFIEWWLKGQDAV